MGLPERKPPPKDKEDGVSHEVLLVLPNNIIHESVSAIWFRSNISMGEFNDKILRHMQLSN